ncbi:MAG: arginine deiminase family protein [Thermodesulfovibrionia bacterium]|nr:arginine deiminase family protein [Thermodesulfovibrionia bacterium]
MKRLRHISLKQIRGIILLLSLILLSAALSGCISAARNAGADTIVQVGNHAEWEPVREVLVHTPDQELFLGVVHPAAALFERAFGIDGAAEEHRNYIRLLEAEGVRVHTVVDALLTGTVDDKGQPIEGADLEALRSFAATILSFDSSALPAPMQVEQIAYKNEVISSLHPKELVSIILQRPTIHLQTTDINTGLTATYEAAPVMNLYFLRDQMITTANGIVISKMNSPQRAAETEIIKFALAKLGVTPIYEVTGEGRLEGGDFLPAGDTAFIGQGLRTNSEALRQMLDNQVFGAFRVVAVKEPWQNQVQMHLDTYFNIIGPNLAVLVEERLNRVEGRVLKADVYEMADGQYKKVISDADFVDYVQKNLGFTLIHVSNADQEKYGINFLTTTANRILGIDGVSEDYKERLANMGVNATWMDFRNLTGGYGAAHCTVQVLQRGY